jgi:putative membrane protein
MVMNRIARLGIFVGLLLVAPELGVATAQVAGSSSESRAASFALSPVDYAFVAQANLGAPFQLESARLAESLAEKRAMTPAVRDYAHQMLVTHGPAKVALDGILQQRGIHAPPQPLLEGAYRTMLASLEAAPDVTTFEREYLDGQVEYQKGNEALFQDEAQNGTDPDLREFARATLPKIEDHLQRASKVALSVKQRLMTF